MDERLLSLGDLQDVIRLFARIAAEQLGTAAASGEPGAKLSSLKLNDKEIRLLDEMNTSNGRFFFRRDGVWRDCYIPYAGTAGVYFFFDEDDVAVYVGKSETAIGPRVAAHVGEYGDGSLPKLSFPEAYYLVVVPFEEAPFLAPAFESFVLSRYRLKYNIVGQ